MRNRRLFAMADSRPRWHAGPTGIATRDVHRSGRGSRPQRRPADFHARVMVCSVRNVAMPAALDRPGLARCVARARRRGSNVRFERRRRREWPPCHHACTYARHAPQGDHTMARSLRAEPNGSSVCTMPSGRASSDSAEMCSVDRHESGGLPKRNAHPAPSGINRTTDERLTGPQHAGDLRRRTGSKA